MTVSDGHGLASVVADRHGLASVVAVGISRWRWGSKTAKAALVGFEARMGYALDWSEYGSTAAAGSLKIMNDHDRLVKVVGFGEYPGQ